MTGLKRLALGIFASWMLLVSGACERRTAKPNSVALFLQGADFQAEDGEQRQEVLRGLNDALEKSPAELKKIRYADYEGRPASLDIVELLTAHFVPPRPAALDPATFYEEVAAPEAKAALASQREKLRSLGAAR